MIKNIFIIPIVKPFFPVSEGCGGLALASNSNIQLIFITIYFHLFFLNITVGVCDG